MTTDLKQQALQAFLRDLPGLYEQRPGEWIAYRGEQSIGTGREKHLLYRDCLERGYDREEFVVFCIEPMETEMWLNPQVLD
jgi:hypothetical protein